MARKSEGKLGLSLPERSSKCVENDDRRPDTVEAPDSFDRLFPDRAAPLCLMERNCIRDVQPFRFGRNDRLPPTSARLFIESRP